MSLSVELYDGNPEGGLLSDDPEGYVGKALETVISFHRSLAWGNLRGARLSGISTMDEGALEKCRKKVNTSLYTVSLL